MALSWSGETAELKDLTNYSRRFKIGLIAVTACPDSALAQAADVVIALPQAREACRHNLAPTTSTLMQQALGDALAIALLESRGFTAVRFAELHPGGRLGAMLKFVRDIMRSGEAMPVVLLGTRMSEALVEMTAKSLGCVLIIGPDGRLQGIITDGDLRRHMQPDLPQTEVEHIMTRSPMTVAPDLLASEALEILNSSKKTQLIVVQDDVPVEASVAATLRPTWPDLPMPVTITRPLTPRMRSIAAVNERPSPLSIAALSALMPPASASRVRTADAIRSCASLP